MPRPVVTEPATIIEGMGERDLAQPDPDDDAQGQLAEPAAPSPDSPEAAQPGAPQPEEFYDWRWHQEHRRVPRQVASTFAQAIGAPSDEAALNWTQVGRDIHNQREQLDFERTRLEQERQELEAERQQLQYLRSGDPDPNAYPGAAGYGPPTRQPAAPGGYPPPMPWGMPGAYPGYPPNGPGGAAPYGGQPFAAPPYIPADPQSREQMVVQSLLSIPQMIAQQNAELRRDIQAREQAQTRREIIREEREQAAQIKVAAADYVERLKVDGFQVPKWFTGELLVKDANMLGLSSNPSLPWGQVFETAAARRLWRYGFQLGQGSMAERMESDREAGFPVVPPAEASAPRPTSTPGGRQFRAPAVKPQGGVPVAGAPAPNTAQARLAAARALGETQTFRQARGGV